MKRPGILWVILAAVVCMSVFASGSACSLELPGSVGGSTNHNFEDLPPEFDRLAEVWEVLGQEHIDRENFDAAEVSDGAIRGMLQSLDDPYASFLNAEQFGVEFQDYQGFFEGIGAQVAMREGKLTIIAPMPGTPAERAGIRPGDIILSIDGETTANISLLEAVSKIRGEKGSTVELLVMHLNNGEPVTIVVERGVIPLGSASFAMLDNGVGHLRIFNFADNTNDEVAAALNEFKSSEGIGLVVDLRNNPGGLLRSVVDIASQFLDDGLVLYEIDGSGQRDNWDVKSGGNGRGFPMVVLINQFSASASEVLSGALSDHDRAVLVGTTSFGKGSVNTLRPLSDGSGIYFSIARWYTPNGTLIEGEGITPEIVVVLPHGGTEDVQLNTAIEILEREIAKVG